EPISAPVTFIVSGSASPARRAVRIPPTTSCRTLPRPRSPNSPSLSAGPPTPSNPWSSTASLPRRTLSTAPDRRELHQAGGSAQVGVAQHTSAGGVLAYSGAGDFCCGGEGSGVTQPSGSHRFSVS